jgi:hypothetical protein
MKKLVVLSMLAALALPEVSFSQAPPQQTFLPEGTPVRMRINRTVSSADAQVGDNVDFETLDDVNLGDIVVIPKGSMAMASITEAVPKRRMARGGRLGMNIDYVRLPSGGKLALRGVQQGKGGGHTGAMTGAIVATSIVFFPAAPFFLFMHGKDMVIPKGHEVTVYTNGDYDLPGVQAPAPPFAAPAAATDFAAPPAVPAATDTAPSPPPQPVTTDTAPTPAGPVTISLGQTIAEVEAINGKPDKIIDLGAKKIYVYKDLKITFTDGKVSDVQ